MTAKPERGDGVDIDVGKRFFDGRTASELRLWDALDADLVVPFHYFGVSDDVDFSQLEWKRGNFDTAQLNIGFCVSVQHAHDHYVGCLGGLSQLVGKLGRRSCWLGFCNSGRYCEAFAVPFA